MEKLTEFLSRYFTLATFTLAVWQWLLLCLALLIVVAAIISSCCVSAKRRRKKRIEEIRIQAEKDARSRTSGLAVNEVSVIRRNPDAGFTAADSADAEPSVEHAEDSLQEQPLPEETQPTAAEHADSDVTATQAEETDTEAAAEKPSESSERTAAVQDDLLEATPESVEAAATAAVKAQSGNKGQKSSEAQSAAKDKRERSDRSAANDSKKQPKDVVVDEVVDSAPSPNDDVDETLDKKTEYRPKNYHVSLREDGRWQVKLRKGEKALKLFNTQAEAIAFAKEKAKNQDGHITIHKVDGKIRKQKY